ncbi:MAG: ANTAR domain-containing protein, partial [Pseudonocardiaceae bacterium]
GRPVLVSDVREVHHARWPMFAAAASRTPARAVYAFPLQLGAIRAGVFDLYRDRPGLLQRDELAAALLCADVALWALLGLRGGGETDPAEPPRWRTDLGQQRAETHQATGMVMAQMEVSAESALATLRAYAYSRGRPLDDVAREVIARRLRFSDTAGTEVGP